MRRFQSYQVTLQSTDIGSILAFMLPLLTASATWRISGRSPTSSMRGSTPARRSRRGGRLGIAPHQRQYWKGHGGRRRRGGCDSRPVARRPRCGWPAAGARNERPLSAESASGRRVDSSGRRARRRCRRREMRMPRPWLPLPPALEAVAGASAPTATDATTAAAGRGFRQHHHDGRLLRPGVWLASISPSGSQGRHTVLLSSNASSYTPTGCNGDGCGA